MIPSYPTAQQLARYGHSHRRMDALVNLLMAWTIAVLVPLTCLFHCAFAHPLADSSASTTKTPQFVCTMHVASVATGARQITAPVPIPPLRYEPGAIPPLFSLFVTVILVTYPAHIAMILSQITIAPPTPPPRLYRYAVT